MKQSVFWIEGMLLCLSLQLAAQQASLLEQAAVWEKRGDWATAAAYYEEHLSAYPLGETEACWRYAHCLRQLYEYSQAENMYLRVWRQDSLHYPDALFYLALSKKSNAEYKDAGKLFARYAQRHEGTDSPLLYRSRMEVDACAWAQRQLERPQPYEVDALPAKVNSPYSESNAFSVGDSLLYFTSLKSMTEGGQETHIEGYFAARLFKARLTSEGVVGVKALASMLNHPQYHNANLCFNPAHTRLYLTRSKVVDGVTGKAEIWTSALRNGRWQKPERMGEPVNLPNTVSTQPCVAEVDGMEIMYFVSDREGGCGGMDIWYALPDTDGNFCSVVNLGRSINTPGNEQTPFYESATQTLYFSSDALPGMGGYDVYASKGGLNVWSVPENLSWPLNSPANEVYFTCDSAALSGYFASNRKSAKELTDAGCCNDIYRFEHRKLHARTFSDTIRCRTESVDSGKSASLAAAMLPLRLYFHNDEPDARSTSDTTELDYRTTLSLYLALRSQYISEYTSGMQGADASEARRKLEIFFRDSLSRRYAALQQFFSYMEEDLRSGNRVRLIVDGHASPLFSDSYNMHLSSRRIHSLWNSIVEYRRGIFLPYMESGQLRFVSDPKGKQQAGRSVSDNPGDPRNSVYSIEAALERRIQISGYVSERMEKTTTYPFLHLPDSSFVFYRKADVDRYTYYIQLKNEGKQSLQVERVEATDGVEVSMEQRILPAQSETFLRITFNDLLFETQPKSMVRLYLHTPQGNFYIPLHFTYFRQK